MNPEQEREIVSLKDQINILKRDLEAIKTKPNQFVYPFNTTDQKILKESIQIFLTDLIIDAHWNKYFYYFTYLESIRATETVTDSGGDTVTVELFGSWLLFQSGTGTITDFTTSGFTASSGATSGGVAGIYKRPTAQNMLRFDKIQRFRTAFRLSGTATQLVAYILRGGKTVPGTDFKNFGFKISGTNSRLFGTVENGNAGVGTNLDLNTSLAVNTTYEVEARLYPNEKVLFLVKNNTTGVFEDKGIITTKGAAGIPTGGIQNDFFEIGIASTENAVKQLTVSYVEYVQER